MINEYLHYTYILLAFWITIYLLFLSNFKLNYIGCRSKTYIKITPTLAYTPFLGAKELPKKMWYLRNLGNSAYYDINLVDFTKRISINDILESKNVHHHSIFRLNSVSDPSKFRFTLVTRETVVKIKV